MQQRGIPARVVDWLLAYGAIDYQHGAQLYYFNHRARQAMRQDVDRRILGRHEKALNCYLVCAEGEITTVGHLYQRVIRH
jgi:hypothetical protein